MEKPSLFTSNFVEKVVSESSVQQDLSSACSSLGIQELVVLELDHFKVTHEYKETLWSKPIDRKSVFFKKTFRVDFKGWSLGTYGESRTKEGAIEDFLSEIKQRIEYWQRCFKGLSLKEKSLKMAELLEDVAILEPNGYDGYSGVSFCPQVVQMLIHCYNETK